MIKRFIFSLAVLMVGLAGISIPTAVSANSLANSSQSVTYAEKMGVCCKLAELRIMTLDDAVYLLRNEQLTITKLASGKYLVAISGGGQITALEIDNI